MGILTASLNALLADFFAPDEEDEPLMQTVRDRLDGMASLSGGAGFSGRLSLDPVRALFVERLGLYAAESVEPLDVELGIGGFLLQGQLRNLPFGGNLHRQMNPSVARSIAGSRPPCASPYHYFCCSGGQLSWLPRRGNPAASLPNKKRRRGFPRRLTTQVFQANALARSLVPSRQSVPVP